MAEVPELRRSGLRAVGFVSRRPRGGKTWAPPRRASRAAATGPWPGAGSSGGSWLISGASCADAAPATAHPVMPVMSGLSWDYTTWLNIVAVAGFTVLYWLFRRGR